MVIARETPATDDVRNSRWDAQVSAGGTAPLISKAENGAVPTDFPNGEVDRSRSGRTACLPDESMLMIIIVAVLDFSGIGFTVDHHNQFGSCEMAVEVGGEILILNRKSR